MFKIGDKVRVKELQDVNPTDCGQVQSAVGIQSIITRIEGDHINLKDYHFCIPSIQLELIENTKGKRGRPRTKPVPVNFLLKYDLDKDPLEEFETMQQVKDRIKVLAERNDLKRDSMVVYEIKRKKIVKIETKISLK